MTKGWQDRQCLQRSGETQVNQNRHVIAVGQPWVWGPYFAMVGLPSRAMKDIVDVVRFGRVAVQVETWMQFSALAGLVPVVIGTFQTLIIQNLNSCTVVPLAIWLVPDAVAVQISHKEAMRIGKPSWLR